MFKILNFLFLSRNEKKPSDNTIEEGLVEKKKCKNCLRRVIIDYLRCPYCGGAEFYVY
jgi:hypothetical protein